MGRKWLVVTVGLGGLAFLTGVNGPLGFLLGWHPATGSPTPTGGQLPFFILLSLLEGLAFGFGVAFLLWGYSWMRSAGPAPRGLTRAAHLSIAWILINWWAHDSFHVANGLNLGGLLLIEYAFHVTLMLAGLLAALWFVTVVRQYQAAKATG
jgi:hypothetical protein